MIGYGEKDVATLQFNSTEPQKPTENAVEPIGLESLTEEQGRVLLSGIQKQDARYRKHIFAFRRKMVVTIKGERPNRKERRRAQATGKTK